MWFGIDVSAKYSAKIEHVFEKLRKFANAYGYK